MEPIPPSIPPPPPPLPPTPPPVPPVPPTPPGPPEGKYSGGGFLEKLDWVEVGFMTIGAVAIFMIINFYRQKAKREQQNQPTLTKLESSVDKMQMEFNGIKRMITTARRQ